MPETPTPQPKRLFNRNKMRDLSHLIAQLESSGKCVLPSSEDINTYCEYELLPAQASLNGKEQTLRLLVTYCEGPKVVEGSVASTFSSDFQNEKVGTLNPRWDRDARLVEGKGLMQLGVILLAVMAYKKYGVARFSEFTSGESSHEHVARLIPEGDYSGFRFSSNVDTLQSGTRFIELQITQVSKDS